MNAKQWYQREYMGIESMDLSDSYFLLLIFIIPSSALFLFLLRKPSPAVHKNLPPGPPGWPVIGNMLDLGTLPHRTLADLRHIYGDIIWLKLGSINSVAISSAKSATELFKNHDLAFADRAIVETSRVHDFHQSSLALSPYNAYWRMLRRLVTVEFFVKKRIDETAFIRRKCVDNLISWIEKDARENSAAARGVHVARYLFLMSFNLIGNVIFSRDLLDPESTAGSEFYVAMNGIMEWSGTANLADFFPWLQWLDPQGLKRKCARDMGKVLEITSEFVAERVKERRRNGGGKREAKDYLDVLLDCEGNGDNEPARFSNSDIHKIIVEMFFGGSETTSSTLEWVLTELLCNPESMAKAKAELKLVIGPNRKVEESDLENLPYLHAVIKETLRLHPTLPLLIPRKARQDITFMGFYIPENTRIFVNAWAIGRDPDVWDEPLSFKPERFMGSEVDYIGKNYELIPFGAGRRMCPGMPLAQRVMDLALASLLHHFDWEFDAKFVDKKTILDEKLGITMGKIDPLMVVLKKCN